MQSRRARSSSSGSVWWLGLAAVSLVFAGVYAVYLGLIEIPERFNPWSPLDVMAAPTVLTSYKLARARNEPVRCLDALSRTGMQYELLADRTTGPGCGFDNAVRLRAAAIRFGAPLSLSCPMALSFFMWERHALQPAAAAAFGQRVVAIDHFGSYACRDVNRGEGAVVQGTRSRHATANALDVSAFVLADGRRISVTQWLAADASRDPSASPWLRSAHAGGCRFFNGVLGPDYNAAHRDHFHLETGGYAMCR
jgi:hypothetical protein